MAVVKWPMNVSPTTVQPFLIGALLFVLTWFAAVIGWLVRPRLLAKGISMLTIVGISWLGPHLTGPDWYSLGYWIGGFAAGDYVMTFWAESEREQS
jgi:hypothetical protein